MKTSANNEITLMQYIFLIHGAQVGIGVLQLPRELAEEAGIDGWISIIVGWIAAMAASLIVVKAIKGHPEGTLLDLLTKYWGKWAGIAGAILFALYFAFTVMIVLDRAILFIKAWLLPQTTDYLLLILFSIPTYIIVSNGFRVLGRYAELVFYLVLWMPFFYFVALRESFHWLHLLPLFREGWENVVKAAQTTVYSFLGFEIAFFLYPFLQKKEKASFGILMASSLSTLVFLSVTLICFVFFSPDQITQYNEPTVSILKVVEFRFIERMEMIFLAFYLFVISTTWMPYLHCMVYCTSWLIGQKDHRMHVLVFLSAIVIYTFFSIPTFDRSDQWQQWNSNIGLVLGYFFPVLLWILVRLRDRFQRRRNT